MIVVKERGRKAHDKQVSIECMPLYVTSLSLSLSLSLSRTHARTHAQTHTHTHARTLHTQGGGERMITMTGTNFGAYSFSVAQNVRVGLTSCASTAWTSDSTIACALAAGVSGRERERERERERVRESVCV
jgi:hypothetical protein